MMANLFFYSDKRKTMDDGSGPISGDGGKNKNARKLQGTA